MKKIISGVGMIVFAAAIVASGTGAFFSDTETSTGNVFTAGAIDLKVDSVAHINGLVCYNGEWVSETAVVWDPVDAQLEVVGDIALAETAYNTANPSNVPQAGDVCAGTWALTDLNNTEQVSYRFFDYGDLKPGDEGENTISLHVFDNDAYMCATVVNVADNDNTQTEPEAAVDADGLTSGELDSELSFVIWEDDGDNVLESEEPILATTSNAEGIAGTYSLYTPVTGAIPASTTNYLGVYWCYGDITIGAGPSLTCNGAPVSNVSQTDSLSADISFYVEQARHNEDFACVRETAPVVTRLTLEKSLLQDEINPVDETLWTLTASSTDTATLISGIEATPAVSAAVVTPGTYVLTESSVQGFNQTSLVCGGNATPLAGNVLTIAAGEQVVCTFTNSEIN